MKNPVAAIFAPRLWLSILFLLFMAGYAKADAVEKASEWSFQTGFDNWRLSPSTGADDPSTPNLLQANAFTKWHYENSSPFVIITNNTQLTRDISFSLKARSDQQMGSRVDDLSLQWEISPKLGFRAGVVDYKTSWCRTYETDSPWMREIDGLCVTPQYRDVTGGAPGAQAYTNSELGDYRIQTLIGLYNPLWLNYAPLEFGNLVPPGNYAITSNKKIGFNLNAINTYSGLEFKFSYIRANQSAYSAPPDWSMTSQQKQDMYYVGMSFPIASNLKLTLTQSYRTLNQTARTDQGFSCLPQTYCNYNAEIKYRSKVAEVIYQYDAKNQIGASYSNANIRLGQYFYDNPITTLLESDPDNYHISTRLAGLTWRHDWSKGVFTILEYIHSNALFAYSSQFDSPQLFYSFGNAVGFRLGYKF